MIVSDIVISGTVVIGIEFDRDGMRDALIAEAAADLPDSGFRLVLDDEAEPVGAAILAPKKSSAEIVKDVFRLILESDHSAPSW